MANPQPTREAIATHLRTFSHEKSSPITEKEWNRHPERLCTGTSVRRLFQQSSWHDVLRDCGITPRDPSSPAYVAHWILAFYAQQRRWPIRRDFKRPCSHWVIKRVFREADNAVAAAVQAKDMLKTLEAQGIVLAEYLTSHFITVRPQPLPSTAPIPASAIIYGAPIPYDLFRFAPQFENDVLVLFGTLLGSGKLKPRFLIESVNPNRFPDCKALRYVPGRKGYVDTWIEFEVRSYDFFHHGHTTREEGCDYIVCWEDNWPSDRPRPKPQIPALSEYITVPRP
jgi:predicted RNA binding protein YcfA (HicA-like mRNA interferase family)